MSKQISPRVIGVSPAKLFCHLNYARFVSSQLRLLILTSTLSFYCFMYKVDTLFVFLLFLCTILVLSFNHCVPWGLPKPCDPPVRPSKPIVWSIGSNLAPEDPPKSGSWVQLYSNGDVYEGEFHEGRYSGCGTYTYYLSGRYEGDWTEGKYNGYGVETWTRGGRYRGQYRNGLRHGCGIYRYFNGDVYAGEWSNGNCHGYGKYRSMDGSRYAGEFKWGTKHGVGNFTFRNGDTYQGEYFADKMHGYGVYAFVNGHKYEGGWHEGTRQGLGTYTFGKGKTQSGDWRNGSLGNHSPEGAIAGGVEEAQKAAEKARTIANIDEDVRIAIAKANRSANAARVAAIKAAQSITS